jgi:hypothetical protein
VRLTEPDTQQLFNGAARSSPLKRYPAPSSVRSSLTGSASLLGLAAEESIARGAGDGDPAQSVRELSMLTAASAGWVVGIALGVVVIAVAAVIVITIVALATRIARQARTAEEGVATVRRQTIELGGIERINDSGVRILHAARALRKVAVGK